MKIQIEDIVRLVTHEVDKAMNKYPEMKSPHEGYAILLEEVDELWDLVKAKQDRHDLLSMRKEAIQVAAMAIRFVYDLTGSEY